MSQRLPGANIYAYRRGPARRRVKPNEAPEHVLQVAVAQYLTWALPKQYLWTANIAGSRGSIYQGVKAKAAGLRKGWPDLQILFPSAVTRYIELKADSDLTTEQKAFAAACLRTNRDIHAVCRSLEEVEAVLIRWKVPLLRPLAQANRYAQGGPL